MMKWRCTPNGADDATATATTDATNGDGDATNGDDDATNGDDDAKTPAETLAEAEKALTDASTDEERAAAMTALEAALMLEGNEAAYVAYLEKKVDGPGTNGAADAVAKEASDKAKAGCSRARDKDANRQPWLVHDPIGCTCGADWPRRRRSW